MRLKTRLKFYLFKYSLYAAIYLGIIVMALLTMKWVETAILFVAFVTLRYAYPKTYHSQSFYRCVVISIAVFWITIPIMTEMNVSIFAAVLLGCVISYIAYRVQDYLELLAEKLLRDKFMVETCTEEQMLTRCHELGFRQQQIDFCIDAFVNKIPEKELSNIYFIEVQSVRNKKQYYKKKLRY